MPPIPEPNSNLAAASRSDSSPAVEIDGRNQPPSWLVKNLRWLGPLCIANVVLLIVLIGGPALRQHYVLEALRAGKSSFATSRTGPLWIHSRIGHERLQPFETIRVVTIDSTSLPLILENRNLFRAVERAWLEGSLDPNTLRQLFGGGKDGRVFQRISAFRTSSDKFDDRQLKEVVACECLEQLTLFKTSVSDEGIALLEQLPNLRSLDLRRTPIGDAAIVHLANHNSLQSLRLAEAAVGDTSLVVIGRFSKLSILDLSATKVTDTGLSHLVGLSALDELQLKTCSITDDGAKTISLLTSLTKLHLPQTKISDVGLAELAKLPKLEYLNVRGTYVTAAGETEFHRVRHDMGLPACRVGRGNLTAQRR